MNYSLNNTSNFVLDIGRNRLYLNPILKRYYHHKPKTFTLFVFLFNPLNEKVFFVQTPFNYIVSDRSSSGLDKEEERCKVTTCTRSEGTPISNSTLTRGGYLTLVATRRSGILGRWGLGGTRKGNYVSSCRWNLRFNSSLSGFLSSKTSGTWGRTLSTLISDLVRYSFFI